MNLIDYALETDVPGASVELRCLKHPGIGMWFRVEWSETSGYTAKSLMEAIEKHNEEYHS